jgi:hypothetical protein
VALEKAETASEISLELISRRRSPGMLCVQFIKLGCVCVFNMELKFVQVLDWLQNHGEGFLLKNCGIGRNLQKALALQRSHQHFERVAAVSSPQLTISGMPGVQALFLSFFRTLTRMQRSS